jgi:hypothetical protein
LKNRSRFSIEVNSYELRSEEKEYGIGRPEKRPFRKFQTSSSVSGDQRSKQTGNFMEKML